MELITKTAQTVIAIGTRALPRGMREKLLIDLARDGDIALIRHLCDVPICPNVKGLALIQAIKHNNTPAAEILIWRGANIHVNNEAALILAAIEGNLDLVNLLLAKGADITAEEYGAFRFACQSGHTGVVKRLIDAGSDLHAKNDFAFLAASMNGHSDVIKILVDCGVGAESGNGTALILALKKGHIDVAKVLLEYGAWRHSTSLRFDSQQDPEFLFLSIANSIIERRNDPKAIAELFKIENRKSLKSDSYQRRDENSLPYFVLVALEVLSVAVHLHPFSKEVVATLQTMILNDIERVERTKGLSWRRYYESLAPFTYQAGNIRDLFEEVASVLVLPELAVDIVLRKDPLGPIETEELYKESVKEAERRILSDKTTADILKLNRIWHNAGNRIPLELRPLMKLGDWYPLFEPVVLSNDITVVCLSNATQLEEEGRLMHHCVAAYASACRRGTTHIVSFRQDGMPVATLELMGNASGSGKVTKKQFRGPFNRMPSRAASEACDELEELINNGKLKFSKKRGLTEDAIRLGANRLHPLDRITGFSLSEFPRLRPRLVEHYNSRLVMEKNGRRVTLLGTAFPPLPWEE